MKSFYLFSILVIISVNLFSQEIEGENFKISVNKSGRVDLFTLNDSEEFSILDIDNKSNLEIYIKDTSKRFYLHEIGRFNSYLEGMDLVIKWRAEGLEIIERFRPIDGNSVNYSVEILNRGDKSRSVGAYFIYDTFLGEESGKHFIDSDKVEYNREKSFTGFEIPKSLKSLNELGLGVEYIFPTDSKKKPERIILGNWEQLSKSRKWPYIPKDGGLFSFGYYSINDSGLGILYPQISLNLLEKFIFTFEYRFHTGNNVLTEPKFSGEQIDSKWDPSEKEIGYFYDDPEILDSTSNEDSPLEAVSIDNISDEVEILNDVNITNTPEDLEIFELPEINESNNQSISRDELIQMLEYVRLKRSGEDVSRYNFNEQDILEVLKQLNE